MNSVLHMNQAALPLWGSRSDLERVNRLLRLESECAGDQPVALASAAISMNDVWFRYSTDGPWILQGYHLHVADGELHEISGPSGSGKTTILRLLAGMLRPERGQIEVGGRDPFRAHGAIAYLPQETYLFEGTIMDNLVRMSRASVSDILAAAEATGLAAMVTQLPMKYDTPVPPGGRTLSGGQRQLIAITACVASRARVLLLDEGFTSMDRITRDPLRCGRVFGGKTVVAVQPDRPRSESER
jgi:ATP-binding cassette subfamily B protein RaxB